ncbi:hypothetical protein BDV39DRAFT_170448 [Aspergillus sergii]|uniref:Uncharacterized protein n=1 Tax=Aspergillus sergii TaxID=1034303 RepID=A0A5N6XAH1_9EURO|nr:hypothetical protein BDV39DRAFT_170448 [Aspergillus sergii]
MRAFPTGYCGVLPFLAARLHSIKVTFETGFLFGYDSGIITSTISLPTFQEYFTNPSDTVTGGIVTAFQANH